MVCACRRDPVTVLSLCSTSVFLVWLPPLQHVHLCLQEMAGCAFCGIPGFRLQGPACCVVMSMQGADGSHSSGASSHMYK